MMTAGQSSRRNLIERVFALDPDVRYCAIVDQRGAHIEGDMRPGVVSINPKEVDDKLFLQTTVSRGMSDSWTRYFDRFRYSIIAHDKLKVFQFPFGSNILLVTAEPKIPLKVVDNILNLLEKIEKDDDRSP
jgi:hypothetical protein